MRLIDADALLDGYKHMGYDPTDYPEDSYMDGWCKGFNAAVDHCMHHVIHAPTIEPKKGKWIPVTMIYKVKEEQFPRTCIEWIDATEPDEVDGVRCSECGTVYDFTEARNRCSECGADMRGGEADG